MAFEPGQIVGEYKIVRPLGRGGLGAVYEATHLISQRSDAMKVLLAEQTDTPDMAERFRREIQMLAALNHPNISGLHNAFYFDKQLVMIMELVHGEDLRTVSRSRRIELNTLISYAMQVLEALDYAHTRGIVHRDIKPANIMISNGGPHGASHTAGGQPLGAQVKVLDFGIAITERSTELTAAGALIGSPTHMSPEQIRGEKATPQSDLYSLGVTLYELIAGQPPLQGSTTYELMMAHIHTVPAPLSSVRPEIPVALSNIVARALEKDPAHRFPSAREFLNALRSLGSAAAQQTATLAPAESWQRITTDEINKPVTASAPLPLEPIIRHLATFIGPIAKIVVTRLAKTYTDADKLYAEAAKQIDNEADRQKFLRSRPR